MEFLQALRQNLNQITLNEPHWQKEFEKECPRAIATHPTVLSALLVKSVSSNLNKGKTLLFNRRGGYMPLDGQEIIETQTGNLKDFPFDDRAKIYINIYKFFGGNHYYLSSRQIASLASLKFNTLEAAQNEARKYTDDKNVHFDSTPTRNFLDGD